MQQHADNAMGVLFQGTQSLGLLMATSVDHDAGSITNIGYFISVVSNLVDALYGLRVDMDYALKKRKTWV